MCLLCCIYFQRRLSHVLLASSFFRNCLVRSVCRQYNELCDRSGQPGRYVVNFASMDSKSSSISVSFAPDRVGRQAICCETAESCNFQAMRSTVRVLTRGALRFLGWPTGSAAWNRWSLRFFGRVDELFGVKPRNLAGFRAIRRDVRCATAGISVFRTRRHVVRCETAGSLLFSGQGDALWNCGALRLLDEPYNRTDVYKVSGSS